MAKTEVESTADEDYRYASYSSPNARFGSRGKPAAWFRCLGYPGRQRAASPNSRLGSSRAIIGTAYYGASPSDSATTTTHRRWTGALGRGTATRDFRNNGRTARARLDSRAA